MDLLGDSNSVTVPTLNPSDSQYSSNNTNAISNNQDFLDLLGLGSDSITVSSTTTIAANDNNLNNTNGNNILSMLPKTTLTPMSPIGGDILSNSLLDDLTGNTTTTTTTTTNSTSSVKITALDKNGLNITLVPKKSVGDGCLQVVMQATNNSLNTLEQYLFQAAVPKSFTLQMLSPTGSVLPPGGTITQEMRLTTSSQVIVSDLVRGVL